MNAGSALSPFRHPAFATVWTATLVSNVGAWMQSAASGWLMVSLDADPRMVAMVQVVTTLPMFLLGLPAGALADILDRRRLLLAMESAGTVLTAVFAVLVTLHRVTPLTLLVFTFLMSATAALIVPAWQAVVPQLVQNKEELPPAVALNSAGINVSRAIGPALAGVIIGRWSIAQPFWLNAVSNLAVIAALVWWRPPRAEDRLPPEPFLSAMSVGLRHARHNPHLRATLAQAIGFFAFASAYWALLPLVAQNRLSGDATTYGLLLGAIGVGAVTGAFTLRGLRARFGPDRVMAAGALGTAMALVMFGLATRPAIAFAASVIAGLSWIAVLATLNVSAQVALPEWVRGRGLAAYMTVMFGALSVGSLAWGQVAAWIGLADAHYIAAAGVLVAAVVLHKRKLQSGAALDLTPSAHWPEPVVSTEVAPDRGPVLVTVEYRVDAGDRDAFVAALHRYGLERRRDGAYDWGLFEDVADPGHWIETFVVDSWLEHLRQHDRVTNADRLVEETVRRYHVGDAPRVTHYIGVRE